MNGFIEVITGTLGGGKTLRAVELMLGHLQKGGTVYTNIEVYPDKIREALRERGYIFDPSRLHILVGVKAQNLGDHIKRGSSGMLSMVVWDEASFDINAKDHQKLEADFRALCILARKLDLWLVLISQVFNDLDNQVRGKVQKQWICRNMSDYRIGGLIRFPIPIMLKNCYYIGGFKKPQYSHTEVGFRRSEAMGLYNTDALLGPSAAKYEAMKTVETSPLERLPTPPDKTGNIVIFASLCASFFASL